MVTKPSMSLTCFARVTIFLYALTLSTAFHRHENLIQDVARKLELKDNELLKTEKKFKVFMQDYSKSYSTREEYLLRLGIFAKNLVKAVEHQALDPTAIHGVTQFSDLSDEEFERFYTGVRGGFPSSNGVGEVAPPLDVEGLPENFDWREKGAVTGVKMQVHEFNILTCMFEISSFSLWL